MTNVPTTPTLTWKESCALFLLSAFICVATCPDFEPVYTTGFDAPTFWAYNYWFDHNINELAYKIFPYGPLGFLKNPVGEGLSLPLGIATILCFRWNLIYLFLRLSWDAQQPYKWLFSTVLLCCWLPLCDIEATLDGLVAVSLLLHSQTTQKRWLVNALIITTLAWYIKASIGVVTLGTCGLYALWQLAVERRFALGLSLMPIAILSIVGLGMVIWGSWDATCFWVEAVLRQTPNYTQAVALYPDNNWGLIGAGIGLWAVFPLWVRERRVWLLYVVLSWAMFAAWKHGFSREDIPHYNNFLRFYWIFLHLLFLSITLPKPSHYLVLMGSWFLFYLNQQLYHSYVQPLSIPNAGFPQFVKMVDNFKKFREDGLSKSKSQIQHHTLDSTTRQRIGNHSIDIYPFDLSYVPANQLNWKPRTGLQSGSAAYSLWYEEQQVAFLRSPLAPQFILWHLPEYQPDGRLLFLDNKYPLNEEPHTLYHILKNYRIVEKRAKYYLLERSRDTLLQQPIPQAGSDVAWNTWVNVPAIDSSDMLRAKIEIQDDELHQLKTFFYKGEQCWIDYRLADSSIQSFNMPMPMARQGIWVNPFPIQLVDNQLNCANVKQIRVRCSNSSIVEVKNTMGTFSIVWEQIPIVNPTDTSIVPALFHRHH